MDKFEIGQRVRIVRSKHSLDHTLYVRGLVGLEFVVGKISDHGNAIYEGFDTFFVPPEACELVGETASIKTTKEVFVLKCSTTGQYLDGYNGLRNTAEVFLTEEEAVTRLCYTSHEDLQVKRWTITEEDV